MLEKQTKQKMKSGVSLFWTLLNLANIPIQYLIIPDGFLAFSKASLVDTKTKARLSYISISKSGSCPVSDQLIIALKIYYAVMSSKAENG